MSSIPVPDEQTYYSSRRQDDVDALAWPVFSQHTLDLLHSAGEVLQPEAGEVLWEAGDPYDLYLVLTGGVLLLDRRDDRVAFAVEEGDLCGPCLPGRHQDVLRAFAFTEAQQPAPPWRVAWAKHAATVEATRSGAV